MASGILKITFPKGDIFIKKDNSENDIIGSAYLKYNKNYTNKFNKNLDLVQAYLDNRVIDQLQKYVSYKTGTQAKSIRLCTIPGRGIVTIGVPYASYQAYSPKIKHYSVNDPLRGKYPFERMKSDKKFELLKRTATYSRRING